MIHDVLELRESLFGILTVVVMPMLGISLSALALRVILPLAWEAAVRFFGTKGSVEKVLCFLFCFGMVMYGSTKYGPSITYDEGLKASGENVVTNNTVSIKWERDTSKGVIVPTTAPVYIDYRLYDDTNAVWKTLAETTVGAWGWSGEVENATNYAYKVWAYYIPPEPVHTNGVWVYKTLKDRGDRYAIPIRASVTINGKAIANPKEKRENDEVE